MTGGSYRNVWDALENTSEDAQKMTMRSDLMIAISEAVRAWKLTQADAAERLGITQPRLNDLLKGRVSKFKLEALITLADRAGLTVQITAAPREQAAV